MKSKKHIICVLVALLVIANVSIQMDAANASGTSAGQNSVIPPSLVNTTVTVTFDSQGGSLGRQSPNKIVTQGHSYGPMPVPARNGYNFGGWRTYTNGTSAQITASTIVSASAANHTLYAKWTALAGTQTASAAISPAFAAQVASEPEPPAADAAPAPRAYIMTIAGISGSAGFIDGEGSQAAFDGIGSITANSDGILYLTDQNGRSIRTINREFTVATLVSSSSMSYESPAFDKADTLYAIVRPEEGLMNISEFDTSGRNTSIATAINDNTTLLGMTMDTHNSNGIYVLTCTFSATSGGNDLYAIQKVVPRLTGALVTPVVSWNKDAPLSKYYGLAFDRTGVLHCSGGDADPAIRKVAPFRGTTILAGITGTSGRGYVDGTGTAARFASPGNMAADMYNNFYVADYDNNVIRKVDAFTGEVTTLIGQPGTRGATDGLSDAATISNPAGICVDSANDGLIYMTDADYNIVRAIQVAPVFRGQLTGTTTINPGANLSYSINVMGAPYPGYQWYKDGVAIPGQTNSTLDLANVQPSDSDGYTAVASNTLGTNVFSATSNVATLVINSTTTTGTTGTNGNNGNNAAGNTGSSSGGGGGGGALSLPGLALIAMLLAAHAIRKKC